LSFRHEVFIHAIEEEIHSFDFRPLANYSTILAKVAGDSLRTFSSRWTDKIMFLNYNSSTFRNIITSTVSFRLYGDLEPGVLANGRFQQTNKNWFLLFLPPTFSS
jgi:hypothetical protein